MQFQRSPCNLSPGLNVHCKSNLFLKYVVNYSYEHRCATQIVQSHVLNFYVSASHTATRHNDCDSVAIAFHMTALQQLVQINTLNISVTNWFSAMQFIRNVEIMTERLRA